MNSKEPSGCPEGCDGDKVFVTCPFHFKQALNQKSVTTPPNNTHQQPSEELVRGIMHICTKAGSMGRTWKEAEELVLHLLTSHSQALRERVEGNRMTIDPRSLEVNAHIATWEAGYNTALDDILALLTDDR